MQRKTTICLNVIGDVLSFQVIIYLKILTCKPITT